LTNTFKFKKEGLKEKDIEGYGKKQVEKIGGMSEKFRSVNKRSVPDRIDTFPYGILFFVEYKAPGKKPTDLQLKDHRKRRALGQKVLVIDTKEKVDEYIAMVKIRIEAAELIGVTG